MTKLTYMRFVLAVIQTWLVCTELLAASISEIAGGTNPGLFTLSDPLNTGAGGLSGLTYDSANGRFVAVDDSDTRVFPVTLAINQTTGAIQSGSIGAPLQLRDTTGVAVTGRDHEGIAFNGQNQSVWISNEGQPGAPQADYAPSITEHRLSDGNQIASLALPPVFIDQNLNGVRINKSLESVARSSSGVMWTANEEALNQDGPASGPFAGTTVRLSRFDSTGNLSGQYAYNTGTTSSGGVFVSGQIGVSDLLVLPDGTLIVMERAAEANIFNTSQIRFHIRLFEVDLTGATEISGRTELDNGPASAAVGKSLLWESAFSQELNSAQTNFEGLSLGPRLSNSDYSLILVADNDGSTITTNHNFYALRISGVPEPSSISLVSIGAMILSLRFRRRKRPI